MESYYNGDELGGRDRNLNCAVSRLPSDLLEGVVCTQEAQASGLALEIVASPIVPALFFFSFFLCGSNRYGLTNE